MKSKKVHELEETINILQMQVTFINSCAALLMSEANNLDAQVEQLFKQRNEIEIELKDVQAELKDTI